MEKDNNFLTIITKELEKTQLFKSKEKKHVWEKPIDITKKNKFLKEKEIHIYDITKKEKEKEGKIYNVNDHVNKSGENPLIIKNTKIKFIDMTDVYEKTQKGIITNSLGTKYKKENKKHSFPSTDIANISIFLRFINPQIKIKGFLVNCLKDF